MAITQTGSTLSLTTNNNSSNSNETITVPADAEIIIVGLSGYAGTAINAYFTGGGATVTIGGQALTAVTGGDTLDDFWQAAMYYRLSPPTGSQSLAWDFNGTSGPVTRNIISVTFWTGIDTSTTPRDTDGVQGSGGTQTSGTLTAQSGDKIVCFSGTFTPGNNTYSFINATVLSQLAAQNDSDGAWGTADPTGNQTVTANDGRGASQEGGLLSIVLIPAAGAAERRFFLMGH